MSTSTSQPLRSDVVIPPCLRFGAEVYLNEGGAISIVQNTHLESPACVQLQFDEAVAVARAILEVIEAAAQNPGGHEDEDR